MMSEIQILKSFFLAKGDKDFLVHALWTGQVRTHPSKTVGSLSLLELGSHWALVEEDVDSLSRLSCIS